MGRSYGGRAHWGVRRCFNRQAPFPRQAMMHFDENMTDSTQILTKLTKVFDGLSKSMQVHSCPSRLDFPILLLESAVDLLHSHFPTIEHQQDSCPEVCFHGIPQNLQSHGQPRLPL